ncbi:MAG: protein translocase subunit SecF [Spirochaetaceae bacterium]|jgi:preprotein translocase subunit SecF|nr:protein translocase subunit SecF [Spirochaetaceae bacterium]
MKGIIRFSRGFRLAAILSSAIIVAGIAGYVVKGGFNLGVDFKAGLMQEIQFAPKALSLTFSGAGNAQIVYGGTGVSLVVTGAGGENNTHSFAFADFATLGALAQAMEEGVPGLSVELDAEADAQTAWLLQSAQGNPQLGGAPYLLHYLKPDSEPVDIADVRSALSALGTVAVQALGRPDERRFMIRMEDNDKTGEVPAEKVIAALQEQFGAGGVAVISSQYVGSQFSKQLQGQAGLLMALTLALIFAYCVFRFKSQFAVAAVIATAHDALIMVAFIAWSRMEFNTTTIAAILTILGYSINDTIVVFDRIRETRRLYQDDDYEAVLNRAISETLSRTVITTLTTMLAVLSLFIFTTGSMKDFALALLIGMAFGVYSTIFIASGFTLFWEKRIKNALKKKQPAAPAAPAQLSAG